MNSLNPMAQLDQTSNIKEGDQDVTEANLNTTEEITVSVDSGNGSVLVFPIRVKLDSKALMPECLDVTIKVEPEREINVTDSKRKINGKRNLKDHQNLNRKLYECDHCKKIFSTKTHLDRHSNVHSKKDMYQCKECDKLLFDKSHLLRHLKTHADDEACKCSTCHKTFSSPASLRRHTTLHDQNLRLYVCNECGKRFPDNSSLKKHAHLHSGVKTHVCLICSKGFAHVGDLNFHMKGHEHVKQFSCDVCGKDFAKHHNMIRHREVHSGAGNYPCPDCNISYQYSGTLTRHIITCHPAKAKVKKTVLHVKSLEVEERASTEEA